MTGAVRIAVLGATDLHTGVALAACFANCFPERPIEVSLWDDDSERLALIERLWRVLVSTNQNPLKVWAAESAGEAVDGALGVIVAGDGGDFRQSPVESLQCVCGETWVRWPRQEDMEYWPHQVLRWVRGDEYAFALLADHEDSPIQNWIGGILARCQS